MLVFRDTNPGRNFAESIKSHSAALLAKRRRHSQPIQVLERQWFRTLNDCLCRGHTQSVSDMRPTGWSATERISDCLQVRCHTHFKCNVAVPMYSLNWRINWSGSSHSGPDPFTSARPNRSACSFVMAWKMLEDRRPRRHVPSFSRKLVHKIVGFHVVRGRKTHFCAR